MLRWVFGADTGPFRSALGEMRNETRQFAGSVKGMLAGVFGGAALLAGVAKIISHFARIKDLADRFGESSESIQRVGYAASQSGMDIESVAKALTVATKNAVEAANAGGDVAEAFDRLGIGAETFANLPLEDKLLKLSEGFNSSMSPAQGLSDLMKVLGKSGAEAIPMLTQSVEELRAQLEGAPVAGEGLVTAIAGIDDKIDELKTTAMAMGAAVVAGLYAIAATLGTVVMGAIDVVIDNLRMLGKVGVNSANMVGKALTGDFKGAADAALNFVTLTKNGLGNMTADARKTKEAIHGIWGDIMGGADGETQKKPDIEEVKKAAAEALKIEEKRKKLAEDISKLEEDSRVRILSLAEKILDAEKRRAQLAADSLFGDDETKMLEARKGMLTVEKDIAGLRQQQAQIDKAANDKATAARKKYDEDIASLTGKGNDIDRSNALAGMTPEQRREQFKSERANALKLSKDLDKNGDKKGSLEQSNKAKELTGQIDEITRTIDDDLQSKLKKAMNQQPSMVTSSLGDIGGGGGTFMGQTDIARKMLDYAAQIAANTAAGSQGSQPPEPV